MRDLTLHELQDLREKSNPEYLRECARTYGLVVTYFPVLLSMAEKYLKLSAGDRVRNGYSVVLKGDLWSICGPHGFNINMGPGEEAKIASREIVTRLNGLL